MSDEIANLRRRVRVLLLICIAGLLISGATAMPLESELKLAAEVIGGGSGFGQWLIKIRDALIETYAKYPFIAYGTDWLAFAHFAIAIAFIGPWRDPVKNVWVVEFALITCVLIVPFALVVGGLRGVPLGWRLIDCSFGVFGFVPLWLCRKYIQRIEQLGAELAK